MKLDLYLRIMWSLIFISISITHSYSQPFISPLNSQSTLKFTTTAVHAKNSKYFSGTLPKLEGDGYKRLNYDIQRQLYKDLDQSHFYVDIQTKKIFQDKNYLSYETFLEISDMTTRYKSYYYTIDLKQKKIVHLDEYLDKHQLSKQKINQALKSFIAQCREKVTPEACEDYPFNEMLLNIKNDNFFNLNNVSTFYLKADILGLSFEDSKFSYNLEYEPKTQAIISAQ